MSCSCCGLEAITSTARADAPTTRGRAPTCCERCGAPVLSDETAALYSEKLRMLARFGLASDTRLLLEPSAEDA
ncbi:MAG TPA: hypothetical protein VEH83_06895 [Gemmatimonadales bacterium]|nr:hypothetical protein [Gemmatimonadales bacterium]